MEFNAKFAKFSAKVAEESLLCVPLRIALASFALKFTLDYFPSRVFTQAPHCWDKLGITQLARRAEAEGSNEVIRLVL